MTTPLIRPAGPDEYPAIGELTHAAYTTDYTDLSPHYRDELKHPEALLDDFEFFVAEDTGTGQLLGTIALLRPGRDQGGQIAQDELYFRLLATHPSARGRGIGIALTQFALDQAAQRGQRAVVMNSGPVMVGAHALYRKLGFRREPDREGIVELPDGRSLQLLTFVRDVGA
ncbi:GNAT family N-acetyltransferase [Leifsonia soli]|uniref:Ribosomal protein S18 acetylase RimI-like enzyme n=1 Tax=Leifsonia soli TaxID=582665 RepID=A0A852T0W5_9MICO|nr:GNAT family N-acetyltransferase [Leifsonia soli]NYD74531.1 ribosomal protein S18 acetylase RimI-like enzyme [Leifsonia soli]